MRKAFTLIEMMISVVILSIIILFLYQSYAALNRSNSFYEQQAEIIKDELLKKRVLFLDFSLAVAKSVQVLNQERDEDVVFMQSANSLHKRFNPYIAYIIKEKKLYRLESLKPFLEYPLSADDDFVVDYIGDIDKFRVYKSIEKKENSVLENYLIHVDFTEDDDILLKVKVLNEESSTAI